MKKCLTEVIIVPVSLRGSGIGVYLDARLDRDTGPLTVKLGHIYMCICMLTALF